MKKNTFTLLIFVVIVFIKGYGQQCLGGSCSNFVNQYPSVTQTPTTSWATISGMNGGNWTLFSVVCGNTYDFTYCETAGGISTNLDAQLTLYNYITGGVLCFSDNVCGNTSKGPYIRWTSNFTGNVRLLTSVFSGGNCQSSSASGPYNRLAYRIFSAPTSTVTITTNNIGGIPRSNAKVKLYNSDYSQLLQTVYTNNLGQVSFNPLNNGSYNVEVFYTPSGNNPPIAGNEEFWGSQSFIVCSAGQSIPITFTRNQPYISSNPSFSPTSLSIGQTTNGNFSVKNALLYSTNSYVAVWVDRNQISSWDYNSATSPQAINAGVTLNFSFNNIAPTNTGIYYYYAFVYSFVNNSYIITDQYAWTSAFTTTCPFLAAPTSPSPGSSSAPGTTLTTLTPTFTWSGNNAGIYHVQIWDAATNPTTNSNVIYGFETPTSSPGHCVLGLSHTIPSGVLVNNGQYKWSVHKNDPCGECESSSTAPLYFQVNTSSCTAPTLQANNIVFNGNDGISVTASWNNGNGTARIVKVNTINSFTTPVNGIPPSNINNSYQGSGEQVVYYGSGNNVYVNTLQLGQTYYFRVYEVNCSGSQIIYNSSTSTLNPSSIQMVVGQSPVANFSTSTPIVVVGQSATLLDLSSNNPTSWSWLIERQLWNGGLTTVFSSIQQNPIFNFTTSACYRITLTATNSSGSGSLTQQCFIYATPNLNAQTPPDVTRAQKYNTYKGGDPVNLSDGTFTFSMRDFSIPGVKSITNLERRYFSDSQYESIFGVGWHHSFDIKVNFSNALDWTVQYPDGHNEHFAPYQNGETRRLYPGNFDTLSYTASGGTPTCFTLVQKDGMQWNFNGDGQIISIVDLNSNQTTFNYSAGNLSTVTLPGGRVLQFAYNGFNKVATVTDNINRSVYYFYDATGHNLDSTRIGNSTTSFRYEPFGMTDVYDPRGNKIVQNNYNAQGQVFEQYDAENKKTTFGYNTPVQGATTITNPLLNSRVVKHDSKSRCIEIVNELNNIETFGYSLDNTLDTLTDARGFKTIIRHDIKGNTIKTINAKGFADSTAYTLLNRPQYIQDKESNIYKTVYNITGNPTHIILPTNDTIKNEFDSRGLDTAVTDPRGFKTKKIYNTLGDLTQINTPTGNIGFSYDAVGRMVEITDSYGRKDSLFWNYFDQVVKRKDKMGFIEEFGYDANGNLVFYKDKEQQITLTEYNKFDNHLRSIEPQNHITETVYDDNQRPIKIRDANKNTLLLNRDNAGRVISVADSVLGVLSQTGYDPSGNIISHTDGLNKTWTNTLDEINRIISTTNPLGNSVQYKYNKTNQVTEYIDEEGKSTKWNYDGLSRHFKTTDAINNYVQIFYNKIGLTDSIRDARGHLRNKATYDGSGRLISLNDGFGNYNMTWDSINLIKTITDPDNRTIEHIYNNNNELTEIKKGANTLRHYELNNNGEYTQANSNTQNASVIRNQLGWISQYTDNYGNTTEHKYDSIGQMKKIIYPGGKIAEYSYNSLNKCTQIKDWNNRIYTITRDKNGGITSILYPNNYKTEIIRDDAYRIKAWVNTDDTNNIFQSNLVRLSKSGNIEKDSGIHVLPFIPLPIAINGVYGIDDRTQSYDTASFTNNNSGQRTSKITTGSTETYSWSAMSELDSISKDGITTSMRYDAFNERTVKVSGVTQIRFIVDHYIADFPAALQERSSANEELINYLYIPGEGILLGRDSAGVFSFYHHNLYGNTAALSNTAGAVTDRYEYGLLTDTFYHAGLSTQAATWMGMYGVQYDSNGLYYLHARYYDGKTGSFISKDPNPINYLNTQDIDRYVYGYNNPLKYIDPTGLCAQNNISYENLNYLLNTSSTELIQFLDNFSESVARHSGISRIGINSQKIYFETIKGGVFKGNISVKTSTLKSVGSKLERLTGPITTALDISEIIQGFNEDGLTIRRNTKAATTRVIADAIGSAIGFRLGTQLGVGVGVLFGPPGVVIGGIVGGYLGSTLGGYYSRKLINRFY